MNFHNLPKLKIVYAIAICFALLGIAVFINGCKRNSINPIVKDQFTVETVKEWYYGTFKRSDEWRSSTLHGKKLPDWNHGIYRRIANMEIIEFPLISTRKVFSISGSNTISEMDRRRILEASVSKVIFIRTAEKKLYIREVDFVPDWEYLKKMNFDVSTSSLAEEVKFSGRATIKRWSGKVISINTLINGVVVKTGRPVPSSSSARTLDCVAMEYCVYQKDCAITFYPEGGLINECGEWYNTGECYTEQQGCTNSECEGLTAEQCNCLMYATCNEGDEEGCTQANLEEGNQKLDEQLNAFQSSNQIESAATINSIADTRTIRYKWECLRQNTWNNYWISTDDAVQTKANDTWGFTSITHGDITEHSDFIGVNCSIEWKNIRGLVLTTTHARMEFDAEITMSLLFKSCPVNKKRTVNCQGDFYIQ